MNEDLNLLPICTKKKSVNESVQSFATDKKTKTNLLYQARHPNSAINLWWMTQSALQESGQE